MGTVDQTCKASVLVPTVLSASSDTILSSETRPLEDVSAEKRRPRKSYFLGRKPLPKWSRKGTGRTQHFVCGLGLPIQ